MATKAKAPKNRVAGKISPAANGKAPKTVKLSGLQQEMLRDVAQQMQMAQQQQNLTLAAILAGHDVKFEDVQQTLKMSKDGTALEYGGEPEA